jgi:hypothetical protein
VASIGAEVAQDPIEGIGTGKIEFGLQLGQGVFPAIGEPLLQTYLEIKQGSSGLFAYDYSNCRCIIFTR